MRNDERAARRDFLAAVGGIGAGAALGTTRAAPAEVAVTISGIDTLAVLRQNLGVARGFKPLTDKEMQALRDGGRRRPPGAV